MVSKEDIITVVGSANVDFFIAVDRLPLMGETMGSKSTEIKSGGKVNLYNNRLQIKLLLVLY